jgi:hypothetical protein
MISAFSDALVSFDLLSSLPSLCRIKGCRLAGICIRAECLVCVASHQGRHPHDLFPAVNSALITPIPLPYEEVYAVKYFSRSPESQRLGFKREYFITMYDLLQRDKF